MEDIGTGQFRTWITQLASGSYVIWFVTGNYGSLHSPKRKLIGLLDNQQTNNSCFCLQYSSPNIYHRTSVLQSDWTTALRRTHRLNLFVAIECVPQSFLLRCLRYNLVLLIAPILVLIHWNVILLVKVHLFELLKTMFSKIAMRY